MNITVDTTPIPLVMPGDLTPTIQNLGPGVIYFDRSPEVTTTSGIRIEVGAIYTVPGDPFQMGRGPMRGGPGMKGPIFVISDTPATDVRFFI